MTQLDVLALIVAAMVVMVIMGIIAHEIRPSKGFPEHKKRPVPPRPEDPEKPIRYMQHQGMLLEGDRILTDMETEQIKKRISEKMKRRSACLKIQ